MLLRNILFSCLFREDTLGLFHSCTDNNTTDFPSFKKKKVMFIIL